MKSIKNTLLKVTHFIIFILAFSLLLIQSMQLTAKNLKSNSKSEQIILNSSTIQNIFSSSILSSNDDRLFKKGMSLCPNRIPKEELLDTSMPIRKKDIYSDKEFNKGPVTYFIDYLETVLKYHRIVIQLKFKSIFDEAKILVAPTDFKDPYSLRKVATGNPFITDNSTDAKLTKEELYKKWLSRDPNFSKAVYENSLTVGQIITVMSEWKWITYIDNVRLEAKQFVDEFDFDGDGRLNFREFIIGMIIKTKKLSSSKICVQCLEDVVTEILNPIFTKLDCNQVFMIDSEQIFRGFEYINRSDSENYNIYGCTIKNEKLRTVSVNDFVLKSNEKMIGYLLKDEFRVGILTALWDRYATPTGINENQEKTNKDKRWGNNGKIDIFCEQILKISNN